MEEIKIDQPFLTDEVIAQISTIKEQTRLYLRSIEASRCFEFEESRDRWLDKNGYTDAFLHEGEWWAFPPNGVMAVKLVEIY